VIVHRGWEGGATFRVEDRAATGAERLKIRMYDLLATAGISPRLSDDRRICRRTLPRSRWPSPARMGERYARLVAFLGRDVRQPERVGVRRCPGIAARGSRR
jgi:hypothetical protein